MILATTIQSEKGKEIIKTANEFINIELTNNRVLKYQIHFQKDYLKLLNCRNGKILYAEKYKIES